MNGPPAWLESRQAAWMTQAGFVRKWISSFRTHSRGIKWTRRFRDTNFIRRRHPALEAVIDDNLANEESATACGRLIPRLLLASGYARLCAVNLQSACFISN